MNKIRILWKVSFCFLCEWIFLKIFNNFCENSYIFQDIYIYINKILIIHMFLRVSSKTADSRGF